MVAHLVLITAIVIKAILIWRDWAQDFQATGFVALGAAEPLETSWVPGSFMDGW